MHLFPFFIQLSSISSFYSLSFHIPYQISRSSNLYFSKLLFHYSILTCFIFRIRYVFILSSILPDLILSSSILTHPILSHSIVPSSIHSFLPIPPSHSLSLPLLPLTLFPIPPLPLPCLPHPSILAYPIIILASPILPSLPIPPHSFSFLASSTLPFLNPYLFLPLLHPPTLTYPIPCLLRPSLFHP